MFFSNNHKVPPALSAVSPDRTFFENEIRAWKLSDTRNFQILGERYYRGEHDILDRHRTVIGQDGSLQSVNNLPNNRIVDNQYAKMVDQKTNYLFGRPFTFNSSNEAYRTALRRVFNRKFYREIQNLCENALNGGIAWLFVCCDETGNLSFRRFEPYEILPLWRDAAHNELDCAVRVYEVQAYENNELVTSENVEIFLPSGIVRCKLEGDCLVGWEETPYLSVPGADGSPLYFNWNGIPLIPFKYNNSEIPLIRRVKSLQDAINTTLSDFANNMQEDARNSILVIKNYDGENLADFRYNLAAFGAVKVRTVEGCDGGVDALRVDVNASNYRVLLEHLKKSLTDNAMGYDAKFEKLYTSPNQMNILSMYSDIDLDANGMETEFRASFEQLLCFINAYFAFSGIGDFSGVDVDIIFNRDMLMNENDIIRNIRNSAGILSLESLVANHPWVDDTAVELERLNKEKYSAAALQQNITI